MNAPHGADQLVERLLPIRRERRLSNLPAVRVSDHVISDLHNIAEGVFTPLRGFMDLKALNSVLARHRLPSNVVWTIPILLDLPEDAARGLRPGREAALLDNQGTLHGIIEVAQIFPHPKRAHAQKLYGTSDHRHPGVRSVYAMGDFLVAGDIYAFPRRKSSPYLMTPRQTRAIFKQRGYAAVAGFQTRNVPHRAHEYLQRCALEFVDGLLIQPVVGWVKTGDYRASVITKVYPKFIRAFYSKRSVVFGVLKTAMRYAGPKEAAFHAIIRKNFGCTHFIVGRDHAGVGDFYAPYAAHEFLSSLGDFGIHVLMFKEPFWCGRCGLIVTQKTCGHDSSHHHRISGTMVRSCLQGGKRPPEYIFRPEVYRELKRLHARGEIFHI